MWGCPVTKLHAILPCGWSTVRFRRRIMFFWQKVNQCSGFLAFTECLLNNNCKASMSFSRVFSDNSVEYNSGPGDNSPNPRRVTSLGGASWIKDECVWWGVYGLWSWGPASVCGFYTYSIYLHGQTDKDTSECVQEVMRLCLAHEIMRLISGLALKAKEGFERVSHQFY